MFTQRNIKDWLDEQILQAHGAYLKVLNAEEMAQLVKVSLHKLDSEFDTQSHNKMAGAVVCAGYTPACGGVDWKQAGTH